MRIRWALLSPVVFICSCSAPVPDPAPQRRVEVNAGLLDALVLSQKPSDVRDVSEVIAKGQAGEAVAVLGQVPPAGVVPFNGTRAAMLMMDPKDLNTQEVQDEFSCPDAETCPACRKLLDEKALAVEFVDQSGATLKTTVQGFKGLKADSQVIVMGKLERDGKIVRLKATGIYVP